MYGENYGTSTLAKSLVSLSESVYHDMDDGRPYEDVAEEAKWLMEGAIVLWERVMEYREDQ